MRLYLIVLSGTYPLYNVLDKGTHIPRMLELLSIYCLMSTLFQDNEMPCDGLEQSRPILASLKQYDVLGK